jgi:leucyl aminopeptidase (aminopeptidase T)
MKLSPSGEFTKHTYKEHPKWNKGIMKVIDKFEKRLAMERWNEVDDDDDNNDVLVKKDDDSDDDNDDDDDDDDDTKLQQTRKRIRPPISSSSNNLRVSVFETNHVTNVKDLNDPRIKEKWTQLTKFNVLYDTVKYLKIEHCQQKSPEWTSKYKDFVNRILL